MAGTILSKRDFYGKLMLFGEHSVIEGSKALIMPFPDVSATLVINPLPFSQEDGESNQQIYAFASWLKENKNSGLPKLDLSRLLIDIVRGLCFRSTIPKGYGLGSSGALCAALYEEYGEEIILLSEEQDFVSLSKVKETLASMESWFHGTSSGTDPLCIYYNKPLIIESRETILQWQINNFRGTDLRAFLLDTGLKVNTSEMVRVFRDKLQGQSLKESFTKQYIPLVNGVVDQFANGCPDYDSLVQLSLFQWRIFHDMIPDKFRKVWENGLDREYYTCKLLGSGGGGYILGFARNFEYARQCLLEGFGLDPIPLKLW